MKPLERGIERMLTAGLLVSATLLVGGLVKGSNSALAWGIILLMLTPVTRVVMVTASLLWEGDWVFSLVSLFVLMVLAFGIWVAGFQTWPHTLPFG
jgi:uncharacterized membrane protein